VFLPVFLPLNVTLVYVYLSLLHFLTVNWYKLISDQCYSIHYDVGGGEFPSLPFRPFSLPCPTFRPP